jgi:hypothetical protein
MAFFTLSATSSVNLKEYSSSKGDAASLTNSKFFYVNSTVSIVIRNADFCVVEVFKGPIIKDLNIIIASKPNAISSHLFLIIKFKSLAF